MRIEPLRNYVVLKLRPQQSQGRIQVVRAAKVAVREAEIVAVGPECRDVVVGQVVLINLLVASEIDGRHLVPEPTILGAI